MQNSHRNSERSSVSQFEEAPLTPIGSTLIQDVFKAAAILGLAIAAVTFFATRSEHPEQLSRLSYNPPTVLATQNAVADSVTAESLERAESVVMPVEVAVIAPMQEEAKPVEPSIIVGEATEASVSVNPSGGEHAAGAPSWNLQRVGMGQARIYRPPVVAPAIELPPMPQREARSPRLPRSLVAD
jgi:hypothetical protein